MAGTGGGGVNELEQGIAEVDVLALQEVVHRGPIFSFAFVNDKQVGGYFFDVGQIVRRDKRQRLRAELLSRPSIRSAENTSGPLNGSSKISSSGQCSRQWPLSASCQ